jgi:predicted transcriptional regulator
MATTIKVPEDLRDRLNARARASDLTVAQVIEKLIAADERAERFRAIKEARARTTPAQWAEYEEETQIWERASNEDLAKYDPLPDEPFAG